MGCEGKCGECGPKKCGCGGNHAPNDMAGSVMNLAHNAWESLMMDKMKQHLEKAVGQKMNGVAAAGVEASIAYWTGKMQGQAGCQENTEKIMKAFKA